MEKQPQLHTIAPVYDENSRILILGSFPSVKSREAAFFYGHPQNRFWRVLAAVLGEETPQTTAEKKSLLLRHGVALWDVIACGDGLNDLSMIRYAGLGVAMANAQPEVKEAADVVTLSNDEDGVAEVIERYILNV